MVIAIIAILAAMLLRRSPGRKIRRAIQCISNQKQMVVAWALYPVDNKEALVPNGGRGAVFSPVWRWPPYLWVYGGNRGDDQTLTNKQYLVGNNHALFAPHQGGGDLQVSADRTFGRFREKDWCWNCGVMR